MIFRHLFVVCIVAGLLSPARAQGQRGERPKPEPFAAEGTIEAMSRQGFRILTTSNQHWAVFVDQKTVIQLTGTAVPEFLRPGLFVKFTAEFDKRGKATEAVKKLTIFTPEQPTDVGFWAEGAAPETAAPGGNLKPRGGFGAPADAANALAPSRFTVHGQIRGGRKGLLTVDSGRGTFQFKMDEEPEIAVDMTVKFAACTVVKKGDKISITKGKMPPGMMAMGQQTGMARAEKMSIELSEPLGQPKKTVPRRKTTRPPPRRVTDRPAGEEPAGDGKPKKEGAVDTPR